MNEVAIENFGSIWCTVIIVDGERHTGHRGYTRQQAEAHAQEMARFLEMPYGGEVDHRQADGVR